MAWTIIVKIYLIIDYIAETEAYNVRVYTRWGYLAPAYVFLILHAVFVPLLLIILYRVSDLLVFHIELSMCRVSDALGFPLLFLLPFFFVRSLYAIAPSS
jgi:hypothetical protein